MKEVDEIIEQTEHEQRMWEYYNKIESENYHLKKQLDNKNKDIRSLKKQLDNLRHKYRRLTVNRKPRYRNNGKGGK